MRLGRISDFASAAPALHGADCDLLELPAAPVDWLSDITTDRDALIRYALGVRPGYERTGRIVGQLAGLLILARLGKRFESDWPMRAGPDDSNRSHAYFFAAETITSTNKSGAASLTSPVARVGNASLGAHSAHTLFIPAKSAVMSLSQICTVNK